MIHTQPNTPRRARSLSLLTAALFALLASASACSSDDCTSTNSCAGSGVPDDGGAEGAVADADGPDVVKPPVGCDPAAEPKDAPKCVVSDFGVFVDATAGADTNPATREAPAKTITAALAKLGPKTRLYICDGTYPEHVKLTQPVSLYGGFACADWTYSGAKPKVAPSDPGYALEVATTTADVTISDLSFVAPNAVDKGQSSIAAFVHNASKLTFLRAALEAGTAKEGSDGAAGAAGAITAVSGGGPLNATGYPASGLVAGTVKICTCASGGTSTGGGGGAPTGAGAPGAPNLGGATPIDGVGGLGSTNCGAVEPNGTGNTGADALNAADGPNVTPLGALDATGWKPQAGTDGPNGTPAQGGGGGGGRDATSAGGGGGCGGCGASGGKAGGGGGASIALLSLDSTLTLRASTLTASAAGQGGKGGAKGIGALGGTGGAGGCSAGEGGKGGDSGAGSGGAGGVSAAVMHKGNAPTSDASTLTPGTKGDKGVGGSPGTNDGPDGQQLPTLLIP